MTDGLQAIYFADPMCSWCWGFAPTIETIRKTYGDALPVRVVMGGLRPGTEEPMTAQSKAEIRNHWQHVHERSGQAFDFDFFERDGFVYDTDPAARAVVAVRAENPELELPFLERVQRAFYAENRDVTQAETLADLAEEMGLEREPFLMRLQSDAVRDATRLDYATSRNAGVQGFPTLVVGPNAEGTYTMLTHGYRGADELMPLVAKVLEAHGAAT
ncbi:DsbA family protein [Aurantimonas manganoxydans]|uniref:DsbA family protein n=1 Tax=Aurantimonas manganoxydans TaxID=651183 RepID=UPI000300514F|nr:DsbA family protein [Aurantimonas manganoxydans]